MYSNSLKYPQQNNGPVLDWLTHFYFAYNPQTLSSDIVAILVKHDQQFRKALIYLHSDPLLAEVSNQLQKIPTLKSSIVVINSSHNQQQRKKKFMQAVFDESRVLLTSVEVEKSFSSKVIDIEYMNLIINCRVPPTAEQYQRKVCKSAQLERMNRGAVINFIEGKYDKYFKRYTIDRKELSNLENQLKVRLQQYNQYTSLNYYIKVVEPKRSVTSPIKNQKEIVGGLKLGAGQQKGTIFEQSSEKAQNPKVPIVGGSMERKVEEYSSKEHAQLPEMEIGSKGGVVKRVSNFVGHGETEKIIVERKASETTVQKKNLRKIKLNNILLRYILTIIILSFKGLTQQPKYF